MVQLLVLTAPPCPLLSAPLARRCLQVRPDKPFRLALGSFIEDYANRVEIVQREWPPPAA